MKFAILEQFCEQFHELVQGNQDDYGWMEQGAELVGRLAADYKWFRPFMEKMVLDNGFLDRQRNSIWPNEVTLYRSPDKSYVVMSYIWEPFARDVIHDHGSWGLVGVMRRELNETKYRRLDDGLREGYAEIEESSSGTLKTGEVTRILPIDRGIHRMENTGGDFAVTVNVYGRTTRKGFVRFFNPANRTCRRVYQPRAQKAVLAIRTLGAISEPWSCDLLRELMRRPIPDFIGAECGLALASASGCEEAYKNGKDR